jgi:hypothetical protein
MYLLRGGLGDTAFNGSFFVFLAPVAVLRRRHSNENELVIEATWHNGLSCWLEKSILKAAMDSLASSPS